MIVYFFKIAIFILFYFSFWILIKLNYDKMYWPNGFANGPGNRGSIPGQVKPKTQKMVLDTALLNTQPYKVI